MGAVPSCASPSNRNTWRKQRRGPVQETASSSVVGMPPIQAAPDDRDCAGAGEWELTDVQILSRPRGTHRSQAKCSSIVRQPDSSHFGPTQETVRVPVVAGMAARLTNTLGSEFSNDGPLVVRLRSYRHDRIL